MSGRITNTEIRTLLEHIKIEINNLNISHDEIKSKITKLENNIQSINSTLEELRWIELKNGAGRLLKKLRSDFYQEIYDKVQLKYIGSQLYKFITILLTVLMVVNILYNILFK